MEVLSCFQEVTNQKNWIPVVKAATARIMTTYRITLYCDKYGSMLTQEKFKVWSEEKQLHKICLPWYVMQIGEYIFSGDKGYPDHVWIWTSVDSAYI